MDHMGRGELRRASEEWHTLQPIAAAANCIGPFRGPASILVPRPAFNHGISPRPPCPLTCRECRQLVL